MHLRFIAAILCLSLVLVQAGNYGPIQDKSIIYRHIQPSRIVVIHHHHHHRGGSSSSSSKKSSKGSGSKSSGKKRRKYGRYRRAADKFLGGSSSRDSLEN